MGNEYFRSIIKQNLKIMSRVFPAGRALRTFEAAARHLNFSRADERLARRRQLSDQDIEAQLGLALFARTSQHPADAGGRGCRRRRCAAACAAPPPGARLARQQTLRLSVGARFATNWLLPRCRAFAPRIRNGS